MPFDDRPWLRPGDARRPDRGGHPSASGSSLIASPRAFSTASAVSRHAGRFTTHHGSLRPARRSPHSDRASWPGTDRSIDDGSSAARRRGNASVAERRRDQASGRSRRSRARRPLHRRPRHRPIEFDSRDERWPTLPPWPTGCQSAPSAARLPAGHAPTHARPPASSFPAAMPFVHAFRHAGPDGRPAGVVAGAGLPDRADGRGRGSHLVGRLGREGGGAFFAALDGGPEESRAKRSPISYVEISHRRLLRRGRWRRTGSTRWHAATLEKTVLTKPAARWLGSLVAWTVHVLRKMPRDG